MLLLLLLVVKGMLLLVVTGMLLLLFNDAFVLIVDTRVRLPTEILLKGMQQEQGP